MAVPGGEGEGNVLAVAVSEGEHPDRVLEPAQSGGRGAPPRAANEAMSRGKMGILGNPSIDKRAWPA